MSVMSLAIASLFLSQPSECFKDCQTDDAGKSLIEHFEGYSPFAYDDVAGVKTLGFGHAIRRGEHITEPLLPPDAQQLLESDLKPKEKAINRLVSVNLKQTQFDAISSWTFNLGEGRLQHSGLLRKVNSHGDVQPEFLKWNKVNGVPIKGLTLRRQAEAELYGR